MAGFGSNLLQGLSTSITANPIGIGLAGFGALTGFLQQRKANQLERNLVRPVARVDSNITKNLGQASINAQTGLADRVYNNALNQLNTGLNAGARQIGRMGGTSSVASTLQAYNQGVNNLNAQDQQAQMQNQGRLTQARQTMAQENQRVWNWNDVGRYNQAAQRIAQLRGVGQQNAWNGLTTLSTLTQQNPYSQDEESLNTSALTPNYWGNPKIGNYSSVTNGFRV